MLIAGGIGFTELLGLVLSTGEIRPVPPGDQDKLLSIDRVAVTQTIDPNANLYSNIGLYAAYGYALLDPILSGVRSGRRAALVDAIMYGESIALTQAFTLATKIGVRRPRPIDYVNCAGCSTGGCADTDLQLSFFSGHASSTGAVSATATYLAFVRSGPRQARPWITLGVGLALTDVRQLRARSLGRALPDRRHHGLDGWCRNRGARPPLPSPPPPSGAELLRPTRLDRLSTPLQRDRRGHARGPVLTAIAQVLRRSNAPRA